MMKVPTEEIHSSSEAPIYMGKAVPRPAAYDSMGMGYP